MYLMLLLLFLCLKGQGENDSFRTTKIPKEKKESVLDDALRGYYVFDLSSGIDETF
uniref:Uncharacterized protein n=1 Tax=Arundo donax TaxID=35708 RepID=A0A0A9GP92_ARUDO